MSLRSDVSQVNGYVILQLIIIIIIIITTTTTIAYTVWYRWSVLAHRTCSATSSLVFQGFYLFFVEVLASLFTRLTVFHFL
jgi:hypothetical protein